MERLISLESLPKSGVLIVTVNIRDYKDSYQNDCRRTLEQLPKKMEGKNVPVKLTPLNYWLGRTIVQGVTRATAGCWRFGFSDMTAEGFKALQETLAEMQQGLRWWQKPDVMIADWVEGND